MSSLWTAHRRTRLNLNGPLAVAPVQTPTGDDLANLEPASQPAINLAEVPQTDRLAPAIPPPETPNAPEPRTSKRKVRVRTETSETDHDNSSGGKRAKLAGGAIAKDYTPPSVRLADLGGVDEAVEKMLELVAMPLCHPEIYVHTGVHPPRGVLLHGPPGCGKTLLANAIAGVRHIHHSFCQNPHITTGNTCSIHQHLRPFHCIGHVWRIRENASGHL
jgi:ribosome biogenesis ATPase